MGVIFAFTQQKGGVGKSTNAVHLAYWLAVKKKSKVLLVDADAQHSSSIWLESLDLKLPYIVKQSADDLLDEIPELAKDFDYLVVDAPAGLSEATRAILFRADFAIVPCQPTGLDLQSSDDTRRLIKQAQSVRGGTPKAGLFLSRAVPNTVLKREALSGLKKKFDIPALEAVVHQRQVVADAFGQSATAWNMRGRPAAASAREFERLFKEVMEALV